MKKIYILLLIQLFAIYSYSQTFAGSEIEPNNTFANATPIAGNPAKVKGNVFPNADTDWFSFTATAGDKIYAAVITSFSSSASTDAQLRLYASDGTTLIEFDDDDGTFGSLTSSIAGASIPSSGTYFIEVKHFSATNTLRGYDLYLKKQTGAPTPETEPNDTQAAANVLPGSGWVSGTRNPPAAAEQDWFSVSLAAGESIFISMDLDPERDNVQYNGRLGVALFGDANNQILVVDDNSTGSVANPLSEAMVFTAKTAGTYYVFADAASAAVGGPTATYNISVSTFAATPGYVNYPSVDIPKTIGPGATSVTSTISIPDSKQIRDISIRVNLNHTVMGQIDAVLTTPNGNTIHLFTDIGAAATGGQTQMDAVFNDNNAIPPLYTVLRPVGFQPELGCKLDMLKGMNTQGTWTLTLYDDVADANGGTLNNWSIDVLEFVPPSLAGLTSIVNENFESTDGGFTHSGTADEWEYGTPATIATTTTSPVAGFTTANSGTKCWKTDLDNTYDASSLQTLESPTYDLTTVTGPIWLSWAMKHQMESASFDSLRIYVEEIGGSALLQNFFQWLGATATASVGSPAVNIGLAAGWGTHWVDISAFAGKQIRFKVTLASETSINFGGVAIDDVRIYGTVACTPSSITLGTSPAVCSGTTAANLPYTATTGTPDQYSIDYDAAAEAAGFVDVVNAALPASPIVLVVPGAAPAVAYNANITVIKAVGGCVSPAVAFTVTVNPTNTVTLTSAPGTNAQTVCINLPITNITYATTGATGATFSGFPAGVSGGWAANVVTISGTPTASGPFSYTVTLTGGCGTITANGTINVTPAPAATIAYTGSPYCTFGTFATVTQTGTAGGTYSSTAGLTLNASTGTVTLGSTIPGTYTVTYTVAAAGGCPVFTTTASITVNICAVNCIENFDGVTVPALPAAWTATSAIANGASSKWATVNSASASAPNAVFTNNPSTTSDESLDSRVYAVPATPTELVFMNNYNLESSWDGDVLEVMVNGGPSTDILAAGGSFVSGGYTGTLIGGALAGRQAWTGNSGGFIQTRVTLPAAALGQNVVFRWRRGTDGAVAQVGTWIDDVYIIGTAAISYSGSPYCSNAGTATVTQTGTPGGTYSAAPAGLSINATTGAVNLGASTAGTYTVTYTLSAGPGCPSSTTTASIVINPTPDVNQPANLVVCNALPTAAVNFTGLVPGTVFNWTNNTPSIGLAASGTGNIASFTATNLTAVPVVATITVTPTTGGSGIATFNYTGTVQTFTVPAGITSLTIDAMGAQGGGSSFATAGGKGARMNATYAVTPGQVLSIVVGQQGLLQVGGNAQNSSGGGGGTFVYSAGPTLLVAAGGGGGKCNYASSSPLHAGAAGQITTNGGASSDGNAGGVAGAGGNAGLWSAVPCAGGGTGWLSNGGGPYGGIGFNLWTGGPGFGGGGGGGTGGVGGFGGGGGGGNHYGGGGGGGGYSGGGGGTDPTHGGGGGSFSSGSSQSNTADFQSGDGLVAITYAVGPTCTGSSKTFTITVNPTPAATISYAGSPYCSNAGIATVTQTGTTGGTYSAAPAGLTINAATGAVTLGTSTAGTYTVTYTIAAAGGCATFTTTASITVTALPAATITYAGSPYCSNAGTATVTRTGTAGGTYSSTAGLTLNAATGDVTLGTSTAGTYTVTYTLAAGGGCPVVTTSTTITITTLPAATISYAGTPYCSTDLTAVVTRTGTAGGTYSAAPVGLTINAATGTVTPNTSTPGTYTVTYTIAAAGGCGVVTATTTITITAAPNMIIFYLNNPYCSNAGTATVSRFGTPGGTYSAAPAGLTINAATGAVTLGTSTPGTYIVTYTIAPSGGCGTTITTTTITITAAPNATIAYAGSPYCSNAGTANVTLTGSPAGGVYSSTAGLSINAATGAVNLGASTAGTYTVTYTVAASGGCAVYTTTTTITITALPAATISYAGSPYCQNAGTATVTRTGTAGGTYSSTAGLIINAATGDVNLAASTAGTYTVTYTIAAGSGCPVVTATASITITTLPAATISYAGNPFCQPGAIATVTRTGTAGGTYSAVPVGLSINSATGDINIAASTAGTYTVSYTLAAGGGCPSVTATTSVTINSLSTAPTTAAASSTSLCGPGSVTLSVSGGSLGSGANWRWYSTSCGGTLLGTGATLTITVISTTTFFVRAEGICNTTTCASVTVTVNTQPSITITASPNTGLMPFQTTTLTAAVSPASGTTLIWYRNGNVVPGASATTLVVNVDGLGIYTARATTGAGCTALSNAVAITSVGATELFITPNPNNGQFKVRYYTNAQQLGFVRHVIMYPMGSGQRVFDQTYPITAPYSSMDVDARHLPKGSYIVMLTDAFGNEVLGTGKVIIQ